MKSCPKISQLLPGKPRLQFRQYDTVDPSSLNHYATLSQRFYLSQVNITTKARLIHSLIKILFSASLCYFFLHYNLFSIFKLIFRFPNTWTCSYSNGIKPNRGRNTIYNQLTTDHGFRGGKFQWVVPYLNYSSFQVSLVLWYLNLQFESWCSAVNKWWTTGALNLKKRIKGKCSPYY